VVALASTAVACSDDDGGPAAGSTSVAEVVGTPGARGVGDPYFPDLGNGGYDVEHYDLALTWHPDEGAIDGVATIRATATQDLSRFDLDLAGLEVASVEVGSEPAAFERDGRELVVTPADAVAEGSSFETVVTYAGEPGPLDEATELYDLGWHTDGREAFVVSEPSGAQTFFPANDHPTDKATYTFRLTTPSDQAAVANGRRVGEEPHPDGTTTWTYELAEPMATYLAQVGIGDLELVDAGVVEGVAIRHALHRSYLDEAQRTVSRTGEMIQALDDVWGPFPFATYGVLAVDEPLGFALETQTLTIIGSDTAVAGRRADGILLHELAHQWVGDAVSPATWKDVWLNEGFATYSEWLWFERTVGSPAAGFARRVGGRGTEVPPGDPGKDELFGITVYERGAATLQALREAVGDDAFFRILRQWVDTYRGRAASTADFIALAKDVSGAPVLDALFHRWLYEPGLPSLD
jgi:aminopeptidase N